MNRLRTKRTLVLTVTLLLVSACTSVVPSSLRASFTGAAGSPDWFIRHLGHERSDYADARRPMPFAVRLADILRDRLDVAPGAGSDVWGSLALIWHEWLRQDVEDVLSMQALAVGAAAPSTVRPESDRSGYGGLQPDSPRLAGLSRVALLSPDHSNARTLVRTLSSASPQGP